MKFGWSYMQNIEIWKNTIFYFYHGLPPIEMIFEIIFNPIDKQNELLKRSKAEQECLLQELQNAKQHWEETQVQVRPAYKIL